MIVCVRVIFISLVILQFILQVTCLEPSYDADGDLNLEQLAEKLGYGLQKYHLTLSDGYIISLYRMKRNAPEKLKPVILVHGMMACADSYFVSKNNSAPLFLFNQNYDVWLLNSRGTFDSLGHTKWNSSTDKEYWKYSWQEMGLMDMPASIDFVLDHNQHSQVSLVGHSEGSLVIFVTLAEIPEYNKKVAISFHWGASVYHSACLIPGYSVICKRHKLIYELTDSIGWVALIPTESVRDAAVHGCRMKSLDKFCRDIFNLLVGVNLSQLSTIEDFSFVMTRVMCGGSVQEMVHYMQLGVTGNFAKFDYGPKQNMKIYNSTVPPRIRLEQISSPVVIWCGPTDQYCTEKTLLRAASKIPSIVSAEIIGKNYSFGHTDFLLSPHVQEVVYYKMLEYLNQY